MELLTFQEAAELAGINVKTIHRHIARGKLHPVETPMGRRLKRTDMDPYAQTRRDSESPSGTIQDSVQDILGQESTQSRNVTDSPFVSGLVPIEAMKTALDFAERRIAEERSRAENAYQMALVAERAKLSLEVQLGQYRRVLSEQAESLAEERALRIAAETKPMSLPEVTPRLDTTSRNSWGQRLRGWFLGSKTG